MKTKRTINNLINHPLTRSLRKGIVIGFGIVLGTFGTTLFAVAVTGTIKTWTNGEALTATDLNTTVESLRTAIEGIPDWTKSGSNAVYTAGNVGIGTSSPGSNLEVSGTVQFRGNSNVNGMIVSSTGQVGIGINREVFESQITGGSGNGLNFGANNVIRGTNSSGELTAFLYPRFNHASYVNYGTAGFYFRNNASTTTMFMNNSNQVGIGTTSPSVPLHVVGNACTTGTGMTACASDQRLKENILPITNALDTITKINPVSFAWNQIAEKEFGYKNGQKEIGVIAQDIEKINPNWVETTPSGYKRVLDTFTKWYSIQAIKELKILSDKQGIISLENSKSIENILAQNQKQEAKISSLDKNLSQEIASLKEENAKLKADRENDKQRISNLESKLDRILAQQRPEVIATAKR